MKYIIVKGWLGFGDRLQCLKMCIKFALDNNRAIYVDWSDSIWSHGSETFYTYFDLVNISTVKSISEIPEDLEVFPSFWKGKLNMPITKELLTEIDKIRINDTGYLTADTYPDVLVYSCIGWRYVYNDCAFFANVFRVIDTTILQKVRQRQSAHQLSKKIGIHLRGTDRASNINKYSRMCGLNIRMMSAGMMSGAQFIAVSDDPEYCRVWKAKYSQFPLFTEVGNLGGNEGVHNKSKDTITISKHALNVDSLVDFFTLASCSYVISTSKDSRFAQEAMKLHKHVGQIIGM
jgi:hypothetical protein